MVSLCGRQLSFCEIAYKSCPIMVEHFQLRFVERFIRVNVHGLMPVLLFKHS
jgi:hypothetical protein